MHLHGYTTWTMFMSSFTTQYLYGNKKGALFHCLPLHVEGTCRADGSLKRNIDRFIIDVKAYIYFLKMIYWLNLAEERTCAHSTIIFCLLLPRFRHGARN